ncbi:MAG: DUF5606 domain-containing protein [Bacteroidales bacterium]
MLKDILSIAGYSGLYKYINKSRNGIIVEHLETKKRMNVNPSARINALEDISIFTDNEDMPLEKVFKAIYQHQDGKPTINPKKASTKELKDYFGTIIPEYDRDRVYNSDIKKILNWYNQLIKFDLIEITEEKEKGQEENKDESGNKNQDSNEKEEKQE